MNIEHPLSAYRRAFGLSQSQLAEKIGVQAPAISKWEARPFPKYVPAEQVVAIARATGVPPASLRPDLYRDLAGSAA